MYSHCWTQSDKIDASHYKNDQNIILKKVIVKKFKKWCQFALLRLGHNSGLFLLSSGRDDYWYDYKDCRKNLNKIADFVFLYIDSNFILTQKSKTNV